MEKLHYHFGGWLGDAILESFPCFIISRDAAEALTQAKLTGFQFDDVITTTSDDFREMYPNRALPEFRWLKVNGKAEGDDFGIAPDLRLTLSMKALDVLRPYGIKNGIVEEVP